MFDINNLSVLSVSFLHHWGYLTLLLAAMLESSPFFGLLVPGQSMVIIGGFFVKLSIFNMSDTILVVAIGAILGDLIGYILGKKYGLGFLTRYGKYFFFKIKYLSTTKKLMNNHTGKTLIFGRFNSLTRAFAPFVAGLSDVSFGKFFAYNIVGGFSWAVSFVLVGYLFGKSYEVVSRYISKFIFIAIILSVIIIYLYRYVDKRRHIFSKYPLYTLIFNLVSLYLFFRMVAGVSNKGIVSKTDLFFNETVVSLWHPLLNKVMIFITYLGGTVILSILSLVLLFILISRKRWREILLFVLSMVGGLLLKTILKLVIHRDRPINGLIKTTGFSFPSGHATMSIIFFSLLIYLFKDKMKSKNLKYIFISINIFLILLIGASRIYLNVHWFSDVLAGFSLGLFWFTLLILIFKVVISILKNKKGIHKI